jgi:hypothetical protein
MKNLPEDEMFNTLERRLRNYSEEPDDEVWTKIADELPSSRRRGLMVWSDRIAAAVVLASMFFILYTGERYQESLRESGDITSPLISIPEELSGDISASTVAEANSSIGDKPDSAVSEKAKVLPRRETALLMLSQSPAVERYIGIDNGREISATPPSFPFDDQEVAKSGSTTASDSVQTETVMDKVSVEATPEKQLSQKKRNRKSGITLYTLVTPQLSFSHVSPLANDNVVIETLESPPVLSMERLGINMEVGIQGAINRRWQYLAGLSYYHQSHRITYEQQSDGNAIITSQEDLSYTLIPSTTQHSFHYSMHNIGVQAGILYTLKQRGLNHKAGIVLQYQKGLSRATDDEVYNNAASDYLNYQLLYRVEYRLNSKMNVFIQPAFTHSIMSNESLQAPFSLKQSRAGIGIGIVYSF